MLVVTDTGPLIHLSRVGMLELLPRMYGTVSAPRTVADEVLRGDDRPGAAEVRSVPWLEIVDLETSEAPEWMASLSHLHAGELAALHLAMSRRAELLLSDDQAAVQAARDLGLRVSGTVGVLLDAKERALLESVMPVLTNLRESGFWLSDRFLLRVAQIAGENPT